MLFVLEGNTYKNKVDSGQRISGSVSIPDGNVGIGGVPPTNSKLYINSEVMAWQYAINATSDLGIKSVSTAMEGTGIVGEGGHSGVTGQGGMIGLLGFGYYGGWFEGKGYFSDNVGIGTTEPEAKLHSVETIDDGIAIYGINTISGEGTTGYGVYGVTNSQIGSGVYGNGGQYSVRGDTSGIGAGVYGEGTGSSSMGVYGKTTGASGIGIQGHSTGVNAIGVKGMITSSVTNGRAIFGYSQATSGTTYGIYGLVQSSDGYSGYFDGGKGVLVSGDVNVIEDHIIVS